MFNIWPFNKPKDELAPETSTEEAQKNLKNMPEPDNKDHIGVARSTEDKP